MRLFKRKRDDEALRCAGCGELAPEGALECSMCGEESIPSGTRPCRRREGRRTRSDAIGRDGRGSRLDEPAADWVARQLDAVAHAELLEDVRAVALDRLSQVSVPHAGYKSGQSCRAPGRRQRRDRAAAPGLIVAGEWGR